MGLFRSTFSAIRKGMSRTREVLNTNVRVLLRGQMLTEKIIDDLEARLITADVGVKAAGAIIDELRRSFRSGNVSKGDDALSFLKARLKARMADGDGTLQAGSGRPSVILVAGVNGSGKTTSVAKIAKSL